MCLYSVCVCVCVCVNRGGRGILCEGVSLKCHFFIPSLATSNYRFTNLEMISIATQNTKIPHLATISPYMATELSVWHVLLDHKKPHTKQNPKGETCGSKNLQDLQEFYIQMWVITCMLYG